MKKILFILLFTVQTLHILAEENAAPRPHQETLETDKKLFIANWPFLFNKKETIDSSKHIDIAKENEREIKQRYMRMVHAALLGENQVEILLDRITKFSEHLPELISFIERHLQEKLSTEVAVKHISMYGSYLYNSQDPDDVDLLLVVESPSAVFEHIEVPAETFMKEPYAQFLPTVSFQVMDLNTFKTAQKPKKSEKLSRGQKIAQQQLAVAGAWYFTLYGFDLRYDPPEKLTKHMKLNYLNKAFNTLNAAGSRLYKTVYQVIPQETERVRLRKVVSRILITDFLIPRLSKNSPTSLDDYETLYDQIRAIQDADQESWQMLEKKLEGLYQQKLEQLLKLAEKLSKIDEVQSIAN